MSQDLGVLERAISPCNKYIAFGHKDGTVSVWSVETAEELCRWKAHAQGVELVKFSPDGRLLLSASRDGTMEIWDVPSGTFRASVEGYRWLLTPTVCFSPCSRYVATAFGSEGKSVKLWRVSDGSPLATFTEHSSRITRIAFLPDGSMLWTASYDGIVFSHSLLDIIPGPLAP